MSATSTTPLQFTAVPPTPTLNRFNPPVTTVGSPRVHVVLAFAKTILVGFVGAAIPLLQSTQLPTTWRGWALEAIYAGALAGFYNLPPPVLRALQALALTRATDNLSPPAPPAGVAAGVAAGPGNMKPILPTIASSGMIRQHPAPHHKDHT